MRSGLQPGPRSRARALVDREPHALLWTEATVLFARVGATLAPDLRVAFSGADVFLRSLVANDLAATGASGRRDFVDADDTCAEFDRGGERAVDASALAAAVQQPGWEPRPRVARLLLEWGLAQHAFGRVSGAKTSFFLAKRETALATSLTGAAGRRLKFQTFNVAQLVLRAASVGEQALAARSEGEAALAAGAAMGKWSSVSADAAQTDVAPSQVRLSEGEGAVADGDGDSEQASAPPPNFVFGGLRQVAHAEADARTDLLESTIFAAGGGSGTAEERAARESTFYGGTGGASGWGRAMEVKLQRADVAGDAAAAAAVEEPSPAVTDGPLSALDQCIVLALCLDVANHNPADGLTYEEMRPYAARVLDTPLNWLVHSTALYTRALLEREGHRSGERAILQLQALVDQHTTRLTQTQSRQEAVDAAAPAHIRSAYAPALAFPLRWDLARTLADGYKRVGAVRSALAVFEELELWDEVVDCLVLCDMTRRAERLVRGLLSRAESPRLWCLLGGLTDDDAPFLRAWALSNHRYARAQLALGKRALARGAVDAAETHLRAGLALSPNDEKSWFIVGCIAMRAERFSDALEALSRVVQVDPTRADAWANMGSIHCHQANWGRGFAALAQALRADKKDWRIWTNFFNAAVKSRNFSRALSAAVTLVELQASRAPGREREEGGDGVDVGLLGVVVGEIIRSRVEEEERSRLEGAGGGAEALTHAPLSEPLVQAKAESTRHRHRFSPARPCLLNSTRTRMTMAVAVVREFVPRAVQRKPVATATCPRVVILTQTAALPLRTSSKLFQHSR